MLILKNIESFERIPSAVTWQLRSL